MFKDHSTAASYFNFFFYWKKKKMSGLVILFKQGSALLGLDHSSENTKNDKNLNESNCHYFVIFTQ